MHLIGASVPACFEPLKQRYVVDLMIWWMGQIRNVILSEGMRSWDVHASVSHHISFLTGFRGPMKGELTTQFWFVNTPSSHAASVVNCCTSPGMKAYVEVGRRWSRGSVTTFDSAFDDWLCNKATVSSNCCNLSLISGEDASSSSLGGSDDGHNWQEIPRVSQLLHGNCRLHLNFRLRQK